MRLTYVALPPDNKLIKGIIVIVPDAFGWEFVNNRLLADQYTLNGDFLVYLPDFMDGRPAPVWLLDIVGPLTDTAISWNWIWKPWYLAQTIYGMAPFFYYNGLAASWPRIRSFFEALRLHEGPQRRIGAAGFCWGGKPVLTLAHPESITKGGIPLVDAVFTGHPSGMSLPGDADTIIKPVSVAIGDRDIVTSMSQVNVMKEAWKNLKTPTEVVVYPGAGHGFCVRVDDKNENLFQQSKEVEKQALDWFATYFGQVKGLLCDTAEKVGLDRLDQLCSPSEYATRHTISIQRRTQCFSTNDRRKKALRACDRCRLRKTKCSGFPPCTRCQRDGFVCTTENEPKKEFRRLSSGYTEVSQTRDAAFTATIQRLYLMVRNGETWDFDEPELDDRGELIVHDIVHKLGYTLPSTEAESPTPSMVSEDEDKSEEGPIRHKNEHKVHVLKQEAVVPDTGLPTPCQAEQSPPEHYLDTLTDGSNASMDRCLSSDNLSTSSQHWIDGFYMDFSAPIWGTDMMTLHWPQSDLVSEASSEAVSANNPLLFQPLPFNVCGGSNGMSYS
ncbi:dienelactone hydrolase family [Fusarium subglutinans]|uniref:Dienelactone hydrolase family n=1 Tax=Gibberella subglutinans TaxID=42677 RepID=A0A8H5LB58_GIBSU|nr:dienelactone hydrolase family [Fusarium subglutinans]KAF5587105.1 dienelactone hydrolase family [Fusarium subglutinans]